MDFQVNEDELSPISTSNPRRHYWQYLIIIGMFVFLPVAQFTMFQEYYDKTKYLNSNEYIIDYSAVNNSVTDLKYYLKTNQYQVGNHSIYDTGICYYNNKCMHPKFGIDAFNNVISNALYIFLGFLFMIIVRVSHSYRPNCGTLRDHSLYYTMGLCLVGIGVFSALYHVCPSPLNFQFDTLFMYIAGAITFMAIYHKRHRDRIPSAFSTYAFLAIIYYLNTISLIHYQHGVGKWAWFCADLVIIYILLHGSINIYYATDWGCDLMLFRHIYDSWKRADSINYPKLILVLAINGFTITMLLYATFTGATIFTDWFLTLFIMNMIFYFTYYIIQKIYHGEKISWYIGVLLLLDVGMWGLALVYYEHAVSNKFLNHHQSDELNEPCVLFNYFDFHDIWHFLSATGLFLFMVAVYFIDDDLKDRPRDSYPVF